MASSLHWLRAVMDINRDQRLMVIRRLRQILGSLEDRKIGLLGLAFKPNTDDLRNAPSLELIHYCGIGRPLAALDGTKRRRGAPRRRAYEREVGPAVVGDSAWPSAPPVVTDAVQANGYEHGHGHGHRDEVSQLAVIAAPS